MGLKTLTSQKSKRMALRQLANRFGKNAALKQQATQLMKNRDPDLHSRMTMSRLLRAMDGVFAEPETESNLRLSEFLAASGIVLPGQDDNQA